jgi:hypothetical protein
MLAHLFDPRATHGQGSLFLDRFLELVQSAADRSGLSLSVTTSPGSDGWSCRKEYMLPRNRGRVDILIVGPTIVIVIACVNIPIS